ncbi:MAG: hypothetical protein KC547_13915 [Anaerolineae bacterium]|nr:hypothetical protein [Anaerolineae bacterium]
MAWLALGWATGRVSPTTDQINLSLPWAANALLLTKQDRARSCERAGTIFDSG